MSAPIDATTTPAWARLTDLYDGLVPDLRRWFADDPKRAQRLTFTAGDLRIDLSKNLVTDEVIEALVALADDVDLAGRREAMFTGQHINVTGYANVGLQLFLPLGPRLTLFGYDPAAYDVAGVSGGAVCVTDAADIRLINDLQWEAAHAVILVAPDTPRVELVARATEWSSRRKIERVFFREEVVEDMG